MPDTSNNVAYQLAVTLYSARILEVMDGKVVTLKWVVKSIVIPYNSEQEIHILLR